MSKPIALPAEVRGYVKELQDQVAALSERAANLAGNLAAAREQNEVNLARIEGLSEEIAQLKAAAALWPSPKARAR